MRVVYFVFAKSPASPVLKECAEWHQGVFLMCQRQNSARDKVDTRFTLYKISYYLRISVITNAYFCVLQPQQIVSTSTSTLISANVEWMQHKQHLVATDGLIWKEAIFDYQRCIASFF